MIKSAVDEANALRQLINMVLNGFVELKAGGQGLIGCVSPAGWAICRRAPHERPQLYPATGLVFSVSCPHRHQKLRN